MSFANITRRADGSYIITRDGRPFHVPYQGEFAQLWGEVHSYALIHPDKVTEESTPEPALPTLNQARAEAVQAVKDRGWRAETAGLRLNGLAIPTDRQSQAMITGAVVASLLNPDETVRWQTGDSTQGGAPLFVDLDADQLKAMGLAVRAHVQACFDLREAKCAAVAALESVEAVAAWLENNLETGWPGKGGL